MQMQFIRYLLLAGGLTAAWTTFGQWTTQTILLQPGWNAVFLEVQPEPRQCDTLFAGLPVESVWRFNRHVAVVEFISNPNTLIPGQPDWLTWLPSTNPLGGQSSLFTIEGGLPYLIKVDGNASPSYWSVRGTPSLRKLDWIRDSLNFVGFPLPSGSVPTFREFFVHSPSLVNGSIYRLINGTWHFVLEPWNTKMQPGEAFWIYASGLPVPDVPVQVLTQRRTGLDFGRVATEDTLQLRNSSTNAVLKVRLQLLSSAEPPSPILPALAGAVPLSRWQDDSTGANGGWSNFIATVEVLVPSGETREVRLAVRRNDMAPFAPPSGTSNWLYQSLLEVTTDPPLTRVLVPVTSEGLGSSAAPDAVLSACPEAGLWVGIVSITNVSLAASEGTPCPVYSRFTFRLIVHVDTNGQAHLLRKAIMGSVPITDTSGRTVNRWTILTDEDRLSSCTNLFAGLRDGRGVVRRVSTAAFAFRDPLCLNPSNEKPFGADGSICTNTIVLDYRDPLNPFVHPYHPDHNNLDERGKSLSAGKESFTISRDIQLTFQADETSPRSGDSALAGTYRETIRGLNSTPLVVIGGFYLNRASFVSTLNACSP